MPATSYQTAPQRAVPVFISFLENAERFVERFAPLGVIALVLLFAAWSWLASRGTRLQFDELLEISAASAPSAHDVVSALASGVDFNPPLSHFLVRASSALFGEAEWAARLPAFLGMTALLCTLYFFVAQQLGRLYGIVAMLVILCLPIRMYAIQARPYGLVLGLSGIALLLYRAALGRRRALALCGLALSTGALVALHYYATLVVGVLFAAIIILAWELKRLDWPLLLVCTVPPLAVLVLLRNVIAQQRHQLTHYFARGNIISFDHGYDDFAMDPLVYCLALLLTIVLLAVLLQQPRELKLSVQPIRDLRPNVLALSVGLLALPLAGAVLTQFVTHAYLTRYFVPASIGFAICACYALRSIAGAIPGLALVFLLTLSMGFGKALLQEAHHAPEALPPSAVLTAESTPILFDTPEAYMQIYHYLPALRPNIWVIADPAAALRYRQYDTDDKIMLAVAAQGKAQTVPLSAAVRRWPAFRLVPRSADSVWALNCVMEAGSQVAVRHPFGRDNFLFDVVVPPGGIPLIDACSRP